MYKPFRKRKYLDQGKRWKESRTGCPAFLSKFIVIGVITIMEINVDREKEMVDIWLTKAEKNDEKLKESLKEVYKKYSEQKYLVAVFMSGEQDLYENTRDLLLYNRRRMAEKEVQAERIARSAV